MDRIKIIILALTLSLVSCKKEEQPEPKDEVNCFCGDVELQYATYDSPGNVKYAVYISRNHCTNAPYRFETNSGLYTKKEFCLNYQW